MSKPLPTATIDPPNFSDGDPSKRPENSSKPVDGPHAWLGKLGSVLADAIHDNDKEEKRLSHWPNGYVLFSQKRQTGTISDFYLWGHPSGYRFRSAAEFAPHLRWLATDPTHDDANCQCIACHKPSGTPRKRSIDSVNPATQTQTRVLRVRRNIEKRAKTVAETPARRTTGRRTVTRRARGKEAQEKKARKKANDEEEGEDEEDEIEDSGEEKTADKESVDADGKEEGEDTVADDADEDTAETEKAPRAVNVNGNDI